MPEIKLMCECGNVQGHTQSVTAASGNRLTCCCSDCQTFALYLEGLGRGNAEPILDQFKGTDIYQMPVAKLHIDSGIENIACVRLKPKGLYRWYTACCHTPIGNTMGANMPFIGVVHNFMQHQTNRVDEIGNTRALKGSSSLTVMRSIYKLLSWKVLGLNKPSVFFNAEGAPVVTPIIRSK